MERKIGMELRDIQQSIKHKIEEERINHNITLTHSQVRVLSFVHQCSTDVYQRDVEEHLSIRRSTATEILNILERDDYILRQQASHDGRLKKIILTEKTLNLVDEMTLQLKRMEALLKENMSQDDLDVFFKVLDQMKENLK